MIFLQIARGCGAPLGRGALCLSTMSTMGSSAQAVIDHSDLILPLFLPCAHPSPNSFFPQLILLLRSIPRNINLCSILNSSFPYPKTFHSIICPRHRRFFFSAVFPPPPSLFLSKCFFTLVSSCFVFVFFCFVFF